VKSICRFLSPEDVARAQAELEGKRGIKIHPGRPLGGAWVLDQLWPRLRNALERLLASRRYQTPVERAIFAMVANRALAPVAIPPFGQ